MAIQKMSTNLLVRASVVFGVQVLDQNQNQISYYPLNFLEKLICQIRSRVIVIEDIFLREKRVTFYNIFLNYFLPLLQKIIPALGPRSVLCTVEVTTSQ